MLNPHKVTRNEVIAPGVHVISFEPSFPFIAGQMVFAALEAAGTKRLYSIASGENDTEISILFDVKPGGALTPSLSQLRPGDALYCSVPQGSFTGTHGKAWWIASGTGVAPFRAMFRSGPSENKVFIHGGRFLHSFYFQEEFATLGDRYIRCCSTQTGEGIYEGRLTRYLLEANLPSDNCKYYLCGSAEMVVETRDLLIGRGIAFDNIVSEIYF